MKRAYVAFSLAALAGTATYPASAWEVDPTENRDEQGDSINLIPFDPLHETITWSALDCVLDETLVRDANGLKPCMLSFQTRPKEPGNKDSALIRGTWWNDDPQQLLNDLNYPRFVINMESGEDDSRTPGKIDARSRMQSRVHFGDLQFLHSMASADGEPAAETRRKVIDWMEFAYAVASGAIDPATELGDIDMATTREFFAHQGGWTVKRLFNPRESLGEDTVPEHVLGTMLHLVEDSYAAGHSDRNPASYDACPFGTIVQFRAYQSLDSDKHAVADSRSALLATDPRMIAVAARLIEFQRVGADWSTDVKPFLDKVFCIDAESLPAGPGEFAREIA